MNKMVFIVSLISVASRFERGAAFLTNRRIASSTTLQSLPNRRISVSSGHCHRWNRRESSGVQLMRRRRNPLLFTFLFSASYVLFGGNSLLASCSAEDEIETEVEVPPFDESGLSYDHYNGVSLHLDKVDRNYENISLFKDDLNQALKFWKAEGRRGIWIHVPPRMAHVIPTCVDTGFSFHFVKDKLLVLSLWLPEDGPSRLPNGPTHQVGVGTLLLRPSDPSQMLVVQEITGPAAARKLWKMPTGLLDPGEDIPDAAVRELLEETGLNATMKGIVCFRHAHSTSRSSDLFFVCNMELNLTPNEEDDDSNLVFKPQPEEIADIRWMPVEEYCSQEVWQHSPVYRSLNHAIKQASARALAARHSLSSTPSDFGGTEGTIVHERLPLGFASGTNDLYKSKH